MATKPLFPTGGPVDALAMFACQAPMPIPDWFDVERRDVPVVSFAAIFGDAPLPIQEANHESVERGIIDWIRDDAGADLASFVHRYALERMFDEDRAWVEQAQVRIEARQREAYESIRHNNMAREVGWRWFWAVRMVEGRSAWIEGEPSNDEADTLDAVRAAIVLSIFDYHQVERVSDDLWQCRAQDYEEVSSLTGSELVALALKELTEAVD